MSVLILLLSLSCAARAQAPQAIADAQKKYDAGDFAGAAAVLGPAAKAAPGDAALQYDLGNALLKAGRLGPAIASYQRAFDLRPRDADIRYNLNFALKQAGEELVPSGVPPLVFKLFYFLSERELAGLQWLGAWAALLLGAVYVRKASWRPALRPWALAALGLWVCAAAWWGTRLATWPSNLAVIVKGPADVRSGPGENFGVSFTAPEGRRVQILTDGGAWLEIGVLKEGVRGWLPASDVERVADAQ